MILSSPINKSSLEEIIQQSFENFGTIFTSSLLDSLKNIGFYYSTSSGVSLTIEDLKIPLSKDYLLADVSTDIKNIEFAWKNGQISNTEKFKSIVNNWELISDSLKEKLIDYYKNYDPTNSLYLMAFSGARGNISQVRQVVGMRGLMVNQRGNIIQLPILTNFKEGLSTIDYIISSYGARKGIIDTALRTADAGYLTRRLIYLVQDISIRDICCNSNYSLLIDLKKNLDNSLLGRTLVEIKYLQNQKRVKLPNLLITQSLYNLLKKNTNIIQFIKIRSSLTCNIPNSLCQYCYGWDLSKKKIISLGDSVGIMAAHSIGEPGTQLTMRTFHTGGIFIGQMKSYFSSNITGKISLGKVSKQLLFENRYGLNAFFVDRNFDFFLINWKNQQLKIELKKGDFFYKPTSNLFKKGDIIGERDIGIPTFFSIFNSFLKPIYSLSEGKYSLSKNLKVFSTFSVKNSFFNSFEKYSKQQLDKYSNYNLVSSEGAIYEFLGKIFEFPNQIKFENLIDNQKILDFLNNEKLKNECTHFLKHKAIGKLKVVSPTNGIFFIKNKAYRVGKKKKISISKFKFLIKKNFFILLSTICCNYQYVDKNTILGYLYIYPKKNILIY
jgi:hypothetical protein|uniref:DNA-directed RNA polymerase n=1 Tax=Poterioochromonas malhamensis TaxID=88167 RepID=A0A7T6Y7J5_9STRA|nr:beta'' subunit of RNA polymerase [Poterioochromonas malhamensis]QQK55025.1 beta'' subunit of RNA polymerase [Poterioochromonas malhamensis]